MPERDTQAAILDDAPQLADMRQMGVTGLRRFNGIIQDEWMPQLQGLRGQKVWQEMSDNEPVCGAFLYAVDKILRQTEWSVEPASQMPWDLEAAEFLESCMDDMSSPWTETISEIFSFLSRGFSAHEIVYKRRAGDSADPSYNSQHTDGRIGWRGFPIRSQDTITRWHFSPAGDIIGFDQLAPPDYRTVTIPMSTALLFRTQNHKNNPEGRSVFRSAYRPWYFKSRIENIEAVGIERELAGLPVAYVPPDVLAKSTPEAAKMYDAMRSLVTGIRDDIEKGAIFPLSYDKDKNQRYKLELLTSGGARAIDTDKCIQRYDQRIGVSTMSDFFLMGQASSTTGSLSMHSDKTRLFIMSITCYLDSVTDNINRNAVPALFRLNTLPHSQYPKLKHGPVESTDLTELGTFLQALAATGYPLWPNPELEDEVMRRAKLPPPLSAMATRPPDASEEPTPVDETDAPEQQIADNPPTNADDARSEALVREAERPGQEDA